MPIFAVLSFNVRAVFRPYALRMGFFMPKMQHIAVRQPRDSIVMVVSVLT